MATMTDSGRTFKVATGETIVKGDRCKYSASGNPCTVEPADAGEGCIGVARNGAAAGKDVKLKLLNDGGTFKLRAAGAIAAGAFLFGADDGEVDDTENGSAQFRALEATSNADELLEAVVVNPVTVGLDATGADIKLYGDTTGKYWKWDQSADQMYAVCSIRHHDHATSGSYAYQLRTEYAAATGNFFGMDCEAHQSVSRTADDVRALSMTCRVTAAMTVSSTAEVTAGFFLLDVDGTMNGTGIQSALIAKVDAGGTYTAVSHLCSLWVDSLQAGTVTGEHELVYLTNNGASTMDQAIYVYGGNKITNLLNINTASGMVSTTGTPGAVTGGTGWIKVVIDGATRYIPLASSVS